MSVYNFLTLAPVTAFFAGPPAPPDYPPSFEGPGSIKVRHIDYTLYCIIITHMRIKI